MTNASASHISRALALAFLSLVASLTASCAGGSGACAPEEIQCSTGSQCQSGVCGTSACCLPLHSSCKATADCPNGMVCTDGTCQVFTLPVDAGNDDNTHNGGCQQNSDCTSLDQPFCLSGGCVECVSSPDCPTSAPVCSSSNQCVEQSGVCSSDISCAGQPGTPRCDTSSGTCVACIENSDCFAGMICKSNNSCGPCSANTDCSSGDSCIAGVCTAPTPDAGQGTDAGSGGTDAGGNGADAGPTESDAGPGGTDAGPVGNDAGTASADGGTSSCSGGCSGLTPICDTDSRLCVQCMADGDCSGGETCYAGICATTTSCTYDTDCPSGEACTAVQASSGEAWDLRCVKANSGGGKGGSPCSSDSDCLSMNCLLLNASGAPADGICIDACGTSFSVDCASGAQCPGEVYFSPLPGSSSGNDVYISKSICWSAACTNDAVCARIGAGGSNRICGLTPGVLSGSNSQATITSWVEGCVPPVGTKSGGAPCTSTSAAECVSGVCLPSGECFGACATSSDCAGGATCRATVQMDESGNAIKSCAL